MLKMDLKHTLKPDKKNKTMIGKLERQCQRNIDV